jgi:hypothetical protein
MNQALLPFYASEGTDARGRTIETVWTFDDLALESIHDYIQWLFPTRKASAFNDAAPQLTDADVAAFRGSPELQQRLRRSLAVMLRFYGLRLVTVGRAVRIDAAEDLARRGPRWWGAGNHNQLRLTRIIDSLATLGLGDEAAALYDRLAAIRQAHATGISDETMRYWRSAARVDR